MAILAHAAGLSMGNTCQLPLLTPKANAEWRLENETKVLSASLRICVMRPICDQTILRSDDRQFSSFSTVLHNPPPLSTGCAQRGNAFELRRRRVRVQSLITDNL